MGCLLFPFELLFDGAIEGWLYLMQWIVPEKGLSRGLCIGLKILVGIFTIVLLISMILGIFALISEDEYVNYIGKFMVFIPLGISVVQIVFGIIFRFVSKKK